MASTARGVAVGLALSALAVWLGGGAALAAPCPAGRATGARGDRLVVGFAAGPPFVTPASTDSGAHGIAIDRLRALAASEGWRLELVELGPETLRTRLRACELDVGVVGVAVSAALIAPATAGAPMLELSQPYLSTVTTVIVNQDDDARAGPAAGHGQVGRIAHRGLRGLLYGLGALAVLAVASWLLNTFTGFPGARPLRWRRIDAAVSGPWAALRWLLRSGTGRALAAVWVAAGVVLGATAVIDAAPPVLGDDPLRALVERAAHGEGLVAERYPDGAQVSCSADDARDCFRRFAGGTLAAIAGPREVLCTHALALSLDGASLRGDLDIPEQYAYVLPPGSPLGARLDLALLRHHERARVMAPPVRCPGGGR